MEHARYEILSDDNSFYSEIHECPGVYASADTLEECRKELEEVLEDGYYSVYIKIFLYLLLTELKSKLKKKPLPNAAIRSNQAKGFG